MRTMKGLLAVAATALALMGLASSAMAAPHGVIRDVTPPNGIIPANRVLHAVGWARFTSAIGSATCHVTSNIQTEGATGSLGNVTNFSIPNVANCSFSGLIAGCSLTSSVTDNLNYPATVTPPGVGIPAGDIDVTGNIRITQTFSGFFCPIAGANNITASAMTLIPLKTGTNGATGTSNHLGGAAALNEPIAGVSLSGSATLDRPNGEQVALTISGELELTEPDRCTWKISAS